MLVALNHCQPVWAEPKSVHFHLSFDRAPYTSKVISGTGLHTLNAVLLTIIVFSLPPLLRMMDGRWAGSREQKNSVCSQKISPNDCSMSTTTITTTIAIQNLVTYIFLTFRKF